MSPAGRLQQLLSRATCGLLPSSASKPTSQRYITTDSVAADGASDLLELMKARRSHYELSKRIPLSTSRIDDIVKTALAEVPSAFNSQSNRVIVLHGAQHERLWNITEDILKAKVPEEKWGRTHAKMAMFKRAAGTILFFVDEEVVEDLQETYKTYADTVPFWAAQSDGMLQYALWTLLAGEGIGANLQHYNPLIDEQVERVWNVPKEWKLSGQLVFGGITGKPGSKGYMPMEDRFKSYA